MPLTGASMVPVANLLSEASPSRGHKQAFILNNSSLLVTTYPPLNPSYILSLWLVLVPGSCRKLHGICGLVESLPLLKSLCSLAV